MLSSTITERLRERQTPFYLYDMDLLDATVRSCMAEAGIYGYNVHYAMKANNDSHVMALMARRGVGADCSSGNEIRCAIERGIPASKIVYGSVGKRDSDIIYALEQDVGLMNCESCEELSVINTLASALGATANVALRINPDVDAHTHKHITTGLDKNKFGIAAREIEALTVSAKELHNVNICGLHFHIGSQITDMNVFAKLCDKVNAAYKWFTERGFDITDIDMGGGLGVDYDTPEQQRIPDFASYFDVFAQNLDLPHHVNLHFELGRALVAQCGELIARVLYTKVNCGGQAIAIVDASMTELMRPALYGAAHAIENLNGADRAQENFTIGGNVCESSDLFAENLSLPELRRGDLIAIKTTGAYGAAMASQYNMHDLPEAVYVRNSENMALGQYKYAV